MKPPAVPLRFGVRGPDSVVRPHRYPNIWQVEKTTEPDRLVVAPESDHIELMLGLAKHLSEPFTLLLVLVGSRGGRNGRYETPGPISRNDTEAFLRRYANFFQEDGRSHLWLMSDEGTIVYDNHNVLYAYGPLDAFIAALETRGFASGDVTFPDPHSHLFNAAFDQTEQDLVDGWPWQQFTLQPEDD